MEEKKKFVEDYRKKIKTELCKNFELKGFCKFGGTFNFFFVYSKFLTDLFVIFIEKCSFAHGYNELKEKKHLHSNYKTKPCK